MRCRICGEHRSERVIRENDGMCETCDDDEQVDELEQEGAFENGVRTLEDYGCD